MESLRSGDARGFRAPSSGKPEGREPKGTRRCDAADVCGALRRYSIVEATDLRVADPKIIEQLARKLKALMWAIDDVEKTRLLLEHGADPNATSLDGRTAVDIAGGNRGSSVVK